jgi:hypothetical protein
MLKISLVLMPILWDVIPICTIFYLHQLNFKEVDFPKYESLDDNRFSEFGNNLENSEYSDSNSNEFMIENVSREEKRSRYIKKT